MYQTLLEYNDELHQFHYNVFKDGVPDYEMFSNGFQPICFVPNKLHADDALNDLLHNIQKNEDAFKDAFSLISVFVECWRTQQETPVVDSSALLSPFLFTTNGWECTNGGAAFCLKTNPRVTYNLALRKLFIGFSEIHKPIVTVWDLREALHVNGLDCIADSFSI